MAEHTVSTPEAGRQRILGLSVLPSLDPMSIGSAYRHVAAKDIDLAYQVGARGIHITDNWRDLAPSVGQYNVNGLSRSLAYLSRQGFMIQMALEVVNAATKETPLDLLNTSFNTKT